jgi:hypothetical protein
MAGVQQPGMTGQVKEDLLSRLIELGIRIENGLIIIDPVNLKKAEFIDENENPGLTGFIKRHQVEFNREKPTLAFSLCGVPLFYQIGGQNKIEVYEDSAVKTFDQLMIDAETSLSVFQRKGIIKSIVVTIDESYLV